MGPPTVETVGEAKLRFTLPFARFTVTGPALSIGAGPAVPMRWLTEKGFTQLGSIALSIPSLVRTASVYAPPSWTVPAGGLQVIGPLPVGVSQPEVVTSPDLPSLPVASRNWYRTASPLESVTVGAENVGVRVVMTEPRAGYTSGWGGVGAGVLVKNLKVASLFAADAGLPGYESITETV